MEIKPNPMAQETFMRLERELKDARAAVLEAGRRAGEAAKQGDLRENAAYEQARTDQDFARDRVLEIRKSLLKPVILKPRQEVDHVDIGNKVTIQFEDGAELVTTLLGTEDGATRDDWLSCNTPLGQAIRGKKSGDEVVLDSGRVKILKVEPGDF